MSKLPKALQNKRDELAAEHAEDSWLSDYQNGFDAGALAVLEKSQRLAEALRESLCHAEEHHEGCLYCGTPLSEVYDEDGRVTDNHRKLCWYYSAEDKLAEWKAFMGETGEEL